MRSITLAVFAACLLAVSGAMAQPFPTPRGTSPIPQSASTIQSFQENATVKKCKLTPCIVEFPAIASNTQILIQHISCGFTLRKTMFDFIEFGTGESGDFDLLSASKTVVSSDVDFYQVSTQAYFFVNAGQVPQVLLLTQGKFPEEFRCTISGQHVPPSAG